MPIPRLPYPSPSSHLPGKLPPTMIPPFMTTMSTEERPFPRDVSSRFGIRLRELRRQHNMTQLRMATVFGIDRSFISDVERGRKSISLPMLEVIAIGMRISLSDLLRDL